MLEEDWGVAADVWSVTSFTELRRDGIETERWNMLHPTERAAAVVRGRAPVARGSRGRLDRLHPRVRRPDPRVGARSVRVLGTDGFGRSDYRRALRSFFEVDRRYVALAALRELDPARSPRQAIERYEIDPEAPIPTSV